MFDLRTMLRELLSGEAETPLYIEENNGCLHAVSGQNWLGDGDDGALALVTGSLVTASLETTTVPTARVGMLLESLASLPYNAPVFIRRRELSSSSPLWEARARDIWRHWAPLGSVQRRRFGKNEGLVLRQFPNNDDNGLVLEVVRLHGPCSAREIERFLLDPIRVMVALNALIEARQVLLMTSDEGKKFYVAPPSPMNPIEDVAKFFAQMDGIFGPKDGFPREVATR